MFPVRKTLGEIEAKYIVGLRYFGNCGIVWFGDALYVYNVVPSNHLNCANHWVGGIAENICGSKELLKRFWMIYNGSKQTYDRFSLYSGALKPTKWTLQRNHLVYLPFTLP